MRKAFNQRAAIILSFILFSNDSSCHVKAEKIGKSMNTAQGTEFMETKGDLS